MELRDPVSLPVVVVGAGFAGTMVAVRLRRSLRRDIILIDRASKWGPGVAYSTQNPGHLLNVHAGNMSAFAEQPSHFQQWLNADIEARSEVQATTAGIFASRGTYGEYIQSLMRGGDGDSCFVGKPVRQLAADVVDIETRPAGFRLICSSGAKIDAAAVVLALGNLQGSSGSDGVVFSNPWAPCATSNLSSADRANQSAPGNPVLIIGTGLTAIDLALELDHRQFPGTVIMLSRRGLLPRPHAPCTSWPTPDLPTGVRSSVPALLNHVRCEIEQAVAAGADWRSVIDSLRPLTPRLWQDLPVEQRARFLRHLRPWWDVHRHRMAPSIHERIDALRRSGTLRIIAGRVRSIDVSGDQATVRYLPRGATEEQTLVAQRVINATGIAAVSQNADPLVGNLIARGLARLDPLGFGFAVSSDLGVRNLNGEEVPGLWALGPIVRGVFWECVAVPEIRVQAAVVAEEVGKMFASHPAAEPATHEDEPISASAASVTG